ncbi:MAG: PilZ domain-containing protein [Magnetococcales bacterium]|nr:PilZ domain-containing protein [Magnetococcales bacterium]NGZ26257.1 PilZ domain-containing protein [Magnetococcales bacterium]
MANAAQSEWERRRQPRCLLRRDAELMLANGQIIKGRTDDAGSGGVFFVFEQSKALLKSGENAVLRLTSPFQEVEEISCRIAHIKENGVGLQVDTSDGRFGLIVSSDLYMDLQKSVGINIPDRIHVRVAVTLSDGRTTSGRVKSITKEHFIFHNALTDPELLQVGSSVGVVVTCLQAPSVEGQGKIRSHRLLMEEGFAGRQRKVDYCTIEFMGLIAQQVDNLNALLSHIQNDEIWGVMKRHSQRVSQPVLSTTREKKSTQEIYQEFNKFFGYAGVK